MEENWLSGEVTDVADGTAMADPTVVDPTAIDLAVADPTVTDPTVSGELRKRRVQVRLTSEQLISEKGLPWVLKNGPKRVRISRRKRSACENLDHILQFYQLWAHELFPKAKFRDFVQLCQTLGKNDKLLRQFREEVFRREMMGGLMDAEEEPVEAPAADIAGAGDMADQSAAANADSDSELYSLPARRHANGALEIAEAEPADEIRQEMEELETQVNDEFFGEDEDALEAMKEMGF